ncbi:MAG: S-layer-like protein array protein [Parcubacteria group bacterium GW2011_GWA1_47_8]|nr:MAG: S-layer-like protein array protein [Parcubacteria group bacterium GW2011_GWA1_47_8]
MSSVLSFAEKIDIMRAVTIITIFFLLAHHVHAQAFISEIMYDVSGTDSGYEWGEVGNKGSTPVDLASWKFFEEGTNHGLVAVQGSGALSAGAYAIIADDAQKFLADHAGFLGAVFDSSFSLKNTGETIALKTPNGTVGDSVAYVGDTGAAGDGNSLQKISGVWKASTPTPGAPNVLSSANTQNTSAANTGSNTSSKTNTVSNTSSGDAATPPSGETGITTRIYMTGSTVVVGAPVVAEAKVFGFKDEPIDTARVVWAFGDGATAEGRTVTHTYYYPGDYTVVIDAVSGQYTASGRVPVQVITPMIALSVGGDRMRSFVAVENKGGDELNLSGWQILSGEKTFIFPKNTILGARKVLTMASEVTGLITPFGIGAELRYPNGTQAVATSGVVQGEEVAISPKVSSSNVVSSKPQEPIHVPAISVQKNLAVKESVPREDMSAPSGTAQQASAPDLPASTENNAWLWYTAVAFLGALAFAGIRFTRKFQTQESSDLEAEDFEIIEEEEDK